MEKLDENSFICMQSNWLINNWCNVFCFKPKLFNVFCLIMVRPSKNPNSTFPIIYLASGEDCPRLFLASSLFVVPFVVIVIIIVVCFPVLVLKCWGTTHMVVTMVFLYVQCVTYAENAHLCWLIRATYPSSKILTPPQFKERCFHILPYIAIFYNFYPPRFPNQP